MKKLFCFALALTMLMTLCMTAMAEETDGVAAIQAAGVLKVGVKSDVAGFGLQDLVTEEYSGLEVDLAHKLAEVILGDPDAVEFTAVTAKTRGPLLDTGELDMVIATFTIKADRIVQYDFSKPYFVDAIGLMVLADSGYESFADLDGKTIGVAQSATTKDALQAAADEAGMTVSFSEYPTYPDIKAALSAGNVDCFSVDKAILMSYLDASTVILPDSFAAQPYGIAVKKGNTALLDLVNETIASMREDGSLDALVAANNLVAVDWAVVDSYDYLWDDAAALEAAATAE
ncbi:MAG TPA: transporter substrate-binding domain-containing protein [Candidatus Limiplasma sp.]|nr:transporter substrate-binding domain-containing protein [Candidatus Limiplasma sp.]